MERREQSGTEMVRGMRFCRYIRGRGDEREVGWEGSQVWGFSEWGDAEASKMNQVEEQPPRELSLGWVWTC